MYQEQNIKKMPINMHDLWRNAKKRRGLTVRTTTLLFCIIMGFICAYKTTVGISLTAAINDSIFAHQAALQRENTIDVDIDSGLYQLTTRSGVDIDSGKNQHAIPNGKISAANQIVLNTHINSTNAVLRNLGDGNTLFDKNGTLRMHPASMTKILTAIIAIESIGDMNTRITLNEAMFQRIYSANAVTAGFLPGESVKAIDLLYGLLLSSGAECAVGLAEYTAGLESAFVELMNEKTEEIGMIDSNFTNVIGLHDENHYSTAMDMAVLLQYALKNDTFCKIFTSAGHTTSSTDGSRGITLYSTLFSRMDSPVLGGGVILGGKTGYTSKAGQCLASLAVKDGKEYILITSGAAGNNKTQKLHIDDAVMIYSMIGA